MEIDDMWDDDEDRGLNVIEVAAPALSAGLDCKIAAANVPEPGTLMKLADLLPHGWTMQVDMQRGSCGVTLFGPFDDMYEPKTGKGLEADMVQAVQFARFREAEQERAVNGAWKRFVAAMGNDSAA